MKNRQFSILVAAWVLILALGGCVQAPSGTSTQTVTAGIDPDRLQQYILQHQARHGAGLIPEFPSGASGGEPVPIPGGLAPGLHVWLPGPVEFGFGGENHEPSTITDFLGFSAIAYLAGVVTADDGNDYDMFHDIRLYRGTYVADDGTTRFGSFVFI